MSSEQRAKQGVVSFLIPEAPIQSYATKGFQGIEMTDVSCRFLQSLQHTKMGQKQAIFYYAIERRTMNKARDSTFLDPETPI